jgi:hypothetical protein
MKTWCLLFLLTVFPASAGDITGVWKVDGAVEDHAITPTCTLKQAAEKITGSCRFVEEDRVADVTGTVNGQDVTWKLTVEYEGTNYTLTFTGKLDSGTSMKGTVSVDPADAVGDFTAKKQ